MFLPLPGDDESISAPSLPQVRKARRKMFGRLPKCAVPGFTPICVDSNDPQTVGAGFRKRLLRVVPSTDPILLHEFKTFVRNWLIQNMKPLYPLGFEEWLEGTHYNDNRKQQLRDCYKTLKMRPTRKECRRIDTFVKAESYGELKHARMINSRTDKFKCWSGPYFKAIEEELYKIPYFVKNMTIEERKTKVNSLRCGGSRYYATDFTAFESHFNADVMDACELQLYRHCFPTDDGKFICDVIAGQNSMRTRTGIRATVNARRMSGDMCTSLGNGFTNLMLALFHAHKSNGVLNGLVEGDDGLFATNFNMEVDFYKRLGFTIKMIEVADPSEASFCGLIVSKSDQLIREPRRVFQTFGWTATMPNCGDKVGHELLRAKALSLKFETPDCPIVSALADHAIDVTHGYEPRYEADYYHKPPPKFAYSRSSPTTETRLLFYRQYGISPTTQMRVEQLIMQGQFHSIQHYVNPTYHQSWFAARYIHVT
jgi:hypothetical protein